MYLQKALLLFVFTIGYLNSGYGQSLVCPSVRTSSGWLDIFPLPCKKHAECGVMGTEYLCCKGFCTKGLKGTLAAPQRTTEQPSNSVVASSSTSTTTSTTSTTTSTTTTTTTTPSTTSSTTTTTTTTQRPTTAAPPPPPPLLQLFSIPQASPQATTQATKSPTKTGTSTSDIIADVNYSHTRNSVSGYEYNVDYPSAGKTQKLVCPKPEQTPLILFPIPCQNNAQCRATSGPDQVCCESRCVKGVPAPRRAAPPQRHQPLLGVIPRECPAAPLGELLFEVQSCKSDADCWPRVCCPDGTRSYCRTARARLDLVPIANQIDGPVRMLEQYLQCTPPPQYDLFPQRCSSSVDCFPNLCCAEGGKKHCRPPQRSLLALLAGVTQRVGSTIGTLRQSQIARNKL